MSAINKIASGLIVLSLWCLLSIAHAGVPQTINYQGMLKNASGNPVSGAVPMTFSLYPASTGTSSLWSEVQSSVTVTNGRYSVMLGSVSPINLPFDQQYYLGVKIGSDPEMAPRQVLASSPYALGSAAFGSNTSAATYNAGGSTGTCIVGEVKLMAGVAYSGEMMPAQGQLLPISSYTPLFSLLGTTYGGNGSTNFALPDMRMAAPNNLTYVICVQGIWP